ncbi:Imm32 family immunity protein [Undibacterium sp. TC4M20W]|uniref:Imm32 family immunity protein n=1 Tax=Undibacterium sp. TC4M20W TaxID=3413052 RepID=UPI003BF418CA
MKIYGYKNTELASEDIVPDELAEITLVASVQELRKIARFINSAADDMERDNSNWEHRHLSDADKSFEGSPQFVLYKPSSQN